LQVLFIYFVLNTADLFQGSRFRAGAAFDAENPKRPDFKRFRIRVLHFSSRSDLPSQRTFHERFQGGLASNRKGLRLHEKVVRKVERRFHMGDDMALWFGVKLLDF